MTNRNETDLFGIELGALGWEECSSKASYLPSLDLHETPTLLTVTIEVPGVLEEDVAIDLQGATLTVRGYKRTTLGLEHASLRRERSFGSFSRVINLGFLADRSGLTARLRAGVLTIQVPKYARSRTPQGLWSKLREHMGFDGNTSKPKRVISLVR